MITSFNALFTAASVAGFRLSMLRQLEDKSFLAEWFFPTPPSTGEMQWTGPHVIHERPFDAARDAFLAALKESPYHAAPEPELDLFG